jgi:DNA primase
LSDERDAIRQRIDIVDLVSQRVRLKRSGKNQLGLCPFHDDKSPSFYVSSDTGRYKCFSCGETGDIFTWVMKTQGLEFFDALKLLADQAGVTLATRSPSERVDRSERDKQLSAMEIALIFFRSQLPKHTVPTSYLEKRKLPADVIDHWELGFAPENGEALVANLKKQNVSLALAKELFLTDTDSNGGYFDKFRNRLMFPIRDEKGGLVGFGGRILGDGNPKYINSGETPLYSKSRILYGLNKAKAKMMKDRRAVLVEGYMDVIACHRAGITEAVASCGTALATDQARLLKRFVDKVTICYDADKAGQKAVLKAIEMFREVGLPCRIAMLPPGEDPDTLLNLKGANAVKEAIESSQSPFDFEVWLLEENLGINSSDFWDEIPKLLAKAESELDLERHLLRIASQHPTLKNTTSAISALRREVKTHRQTKKKEKAEQATAIIREFTFLLPAEAIIFKALLDERYRRSYWRYVNDDTIFQTPAAERLRTALFTAFRDSAPSGSPSLWISDLDDEIATQTMVDLNLDLRVQSLNESYVEGAVQNLRTLSATQNLTRKRPTESHPNDKDLAEYLANLRKIKKIEG